MKRSNKPVIEINASNDHCGDGKSEAKKGQTNIAPSFFSSPLRVKDVSFLFFGYILSGILALIEF